MGHHAKLEEAGGNGGPTKAGQRTPSNTYFKFVGESPTYSFYFGGDAATMPTWTLGRLLIFVNGIRNSSLR